MQWKFLLSPYAEEDQEHQEVVLSRVDFDDSHWADINIGQAWEDQGYVGYDEGAWYRAQIEVDAEEGWPVHLAFGGVDNEAYVYVNGTFVGEHYWWNTPFILDVSEAVNYKGHNTVAVWVYDGANMGGIYGTIEVTNPPKRGTSTAIWPIAVSRRSRSRPIETAQRSGGASGVAFSSTGSIAGTATALAYSASHSQEIDNGQGGSSFSAYEGAGGPAQFVL